MRGVILASTRSDAGFAECLRGLPEVFNARQRPWIAPDAASAALVAEVIRRCPSGALHYQASGIPGEQPDVPTTIRAVEHGPFLVRGDLRIYAADGPVTDTRAALCRCTRSSRPPFCDAACDAPRAVKLGRSPRRTATVIHQNSPSALQRLAGYEISRSDHGPQLLEQLLEDVHVREVALGSGYILTGHAPPQTVSDSWPLAE